MKVNYLVLLILATTLFLNGCSSDPVNTARNEVEVIDHRQIDKTDMDAVVSKYIMFRANIFHPSTEKQFEVHRIYGKEENGNKTTIYLFSIFSGFTSKDGYFNLEAHSSRHVVIELENNNGEYAVVDYQDSLVTEDVNWMFPKKYADMALKDNIKDLHSSLISNVESWLQSEGRTEKLNSNE